MNFAPTPIPELDPVRAVMQVMVAMVRMVSSHFGSSAVGPAPLMKARHVYHNVHDGTH